MPDHVDFFGQELKVGDEVAYAPADRGRELSSGVIVGFSKTGPERLLVETPSWWNKDKMSTFKPFPKEVVKKPVIQ